MTRNLSRWQQHLCGHSLGEETNEDLILLWRQSVNLGSVFMFFFPPQAKPLSCGNSCSSKISKNKQEVNSFLFQNFTLKDENSAHVDEVEDRCHEVMDIGTNCLCRLLSNIISLQSFCSSTSQQKSAFESNAEQNLNLQMQEMLKIKMIWTLNKQIFVSVNVWLWCGAHHIFEWMQKQACLKYLEIGFGFGDPTTSNDFCCQLVNIAIFKCSLPCNCFS